MRGIILTVGLAGMIVAGAACGSSSSNSYTSSASTPAVTAQAAVTQAVTTQVAASAPTQAAPSSAGAAAQATPATNPVERVSGTVQSVDGDKVVLKEGNSFTLTGQTTVTRRVSGTVSALQSGQTVAVTAKRQPDNTLLASLIVVFSTPPTGFPLGQRPMDAGNLMTNATIDTVQASGFTVTFPGGGAQVNLAPDAQIQMLTTGTRSDITVGAAITASVRDSVAQSVSIQ